MMSFSFWRKRSTLSQIKKFKVEGDVGGEKGRSIL